MWATLDRQIDPCGRRIVRQPGNPGGRWKGKPTMAKRRRSVCWNRVEQIVALAALVTNEAIKVIDALHVR